MDFLKILQVIAAFIPIIGVGIVALHRIEGFYILNAGQIIGISYFVITKQYWFAVQMGILTIFNSYGIYNWKKKGVGKEPIKWPWKKENKNGCKTIKRIL